MPLRLIIENTPPEELAPMPEHPFNDFIETAIRNAKNSKASNRGAILADVCKVLNCRVEDLNFLFERQTVPSRSRQIFGLEMPDYRMNISEIYKEVAE